ncbi:MAG: RteC domain-containing protein [Chitinophagaceae bacterium]|nr:RteC domain-containing protein [Chitinophagaceae bacterium]
MYDTFTDKYDKLLSRYVAHIERNMKERLTNARDKVAVFEDIGSELANVNRLMLATPKAAELLGNFVQQYKSGVTIDEILEDLKLRYGYDDEAFAGHINKHTDLTIYYANDEDRRFTLLASEKPKLLKFLVRYMATQQIKERLSSLSIKADKTSQAENITLYPVIWTGSRNNNNEFVQLIYGLHEAGYLNEGNGEITKIVESLASILKISLGKGWQSNLSSSVHKSKKDYEPPVFEKIKQAYLRYADDLIMAKKTNK